MMTVRMLIKLLNAFDPDLPICYSKYSEHCLLVSDELKVKKLGAPRPDGWVHDERPDKESTEYLVFPGN